MDGLRTRPRVRVRTLLIIVAVAAVPLGVWSEYLSPPRQWRKALRGDRHTEEGMKLIISGVAGKVPGLSREVVITELIDAANDTRVSVRRHSVMGLLGLRPPCDAAVPSLAALTERDPEEDIRWISALVLGEIVKKSGSTSTRAAAKSALVACLKDRSDVVRAVAAGALLQVGEDELAFPTLNYVLGELRTSGDHFRGPADHALAALRSVGTRARPAIPALLHFVGEFAGANPLRGRTREQYRSQAAHLLVRLGERSATLEVLEKARHAEDSAKRRCAQDLMVELGAIPHPFLDDTAARRNKDQ